MNSTIRAELRAVHWSPVSAGLAAAAGLAVLDLTLWPGGPGSQLLWLVASLLAGSVAVTLDDPAAPLTLAMPTRRSWRTAIRMLVAVVALATWSGYVAQVVAVSPAAEPASWLALILIGGAIVLAAAGPAAALGRALAGEPGSVVASMTVVLVLGLMILPLPRDLSAYDVSQRWNDATALWLVLGATGTAALMWGAGDPWRRRFDQRLTATIVSGNLSASGLRQSK